MSESNLKKKKKSQKRKDSECDILTQYTPELFEEKISKNKSSLMI